MHRGACVAHVPMSGDVDDDLETLEDLEDDLGIRIEVQGLLGGTGSGVSPGAARSADASTYARGAGESSSSNSDSDSDSDASGHQSHRASHRSHRCVCQPY